MQVYSPGGFSSSGLFLLTYFFKELMTAQARNIHQTMVATIATTKPGNLGKPREPLSDVGRVV
jgi:hypothetical protein